MRKSRSIFLRGQKNRALHYARLLQEHDQHAASQLGSAPHHNEKRGRFEEYVEHHLRSSHPNLGDRKAEGQDRDNHIGFGEHIDGGMLITRDKGPLTVNYSAHSKFDAFDS